MSSARPDEKRVQARVPLRWRVDARVITEQERIDILAGLGHPDLESEALAMSRPRWGMQRVGSRDVSGSGMRLEVGLLGEVPAGSALSLDLHLPGDHRVVKLLGDVIWAGRSEGRPVAGLRIAALDLEGWSRLLKALGGAPKSRP